MATTEAEPNAQTQYIIFVDSMEESNKDGNIPGTPATKVQVIGKLHILSIIVVIIFAALSSLLLFNEIVKQHPNQPQLIIMPHQANSSIPKNSLTVLPIGINSTFNAIKPASIAYIMSNNAIITPSGVDSFLLNFSISGMGFLNATYNASRCNIPEYSKIYSQALNKHNSTTPYAFNLSLPFTIYINMYVGNNTSWWLSQPYSSCIGGLLPAQLLDAASIRSTYISASRTYYASNFTELDNVNLTELDNSQINGMPANGIYYTNNSSISIYAMDVPYHNVLMRIYLWGATDKMNMSNIISTTKNTFISLISK